MSASLPKNTKSLCTRCFPVVFIMLLCSATSLHAAGNNSDSIYVSGYAIKLISENQSQFGYNIFKEKKLLIHQPSIPAVPGRNGFATKADAEKTARKMVEKMKNGESLPTISIDEMKQMGISLQSSGSH